MITCVFWRRMSGGTRVSGLRTHVMWLRLQEPGLLPKRSTGRQKSDPGNVVTLRRRQRLVHPSNIASDVSPKVCLSVVLCLCADFGIGLVCVCKLDASCSETKHYRQAYLW